uniref:Uncharacterized protein n=1 Tax=Brassica oleracea TaxID=3712 RepID=A0A3P6H1Y6_BRAOL|nr:unnamed protein product [Brassica oleracea]
MVDQRVKKRYMFGTSMLSIALFLLSPRLSFMVDLGLISSVS